MFRVVAMVAVVVVDGLRVLLMSARCRGCRRGGRALEESLDLEQLGGAEKVLQLVLRDGHLSGVDEPALHK